MDKYYEKAGILIEALPYIQHFSGKTVVIKYGGAAMLSDELSEKIMQDITLLKYVGVNPIVVHGGGNDINKMLKKFDISSEFHNGLRITNKATMDIVQMVLMGKINKDIVSQIIVAGAKAIGLCGKDASLIQAEKLTSEDGYDLGHVGRITGINTKLLNFLANDEYIPVIAPIGVGKNGESYNINADIVAGEIAAALRAEKLMFLTDTDGIRRIPNDPNTLIFEISIDEIYQYIKNGIISGGMLPKVEGCIKAIRSGVKRTHILNGTIPHPIILEIFTDTGIGTMVRE
ncbi:MAG: acetylglutamate kinase [Christensenellales bacterium]|jgi:acetylglutamate kinase